MIQKQRRLIKEFLKLPCEPSQNWNWKSNFILLVLCKSILKLLMHFKDKQVISDLIHCLRFQYSKALSR